MFSTFAWSSIKPCVNALTKELKPTEWTEVEKITETKKDDKSQASIQ